MVSAFLTRLGRPIQWPNLVRAYRACLNSPAATEHILPDLAEFCGASDPAPKIPDLFMQGRHAGRRDVWLRIQGFLHLSDADLMALHTGRPIVRRETNIE